jgi:glycolate oxidase iron-sulfur subunit
LITACATCTSTIKQMWPLMAQDYSEAEQAQIAALTRKVMDINQFLVDKVGLEPRLAPELQERKPLVFHDPCHLKKSLGVADQPRALIRANPGYELREMMEADWCCGCGGSFTLQEYEISAAIGRRKRQNIERSGCAVVATGCPACMIQLTDMLSQAGSQVQVKHAAEI